MQALARSLREIHTEVPVPWPSLARHIQPRVGGLVIVTAAPGAGKSTFALNWALGIDEPTLYCSFDTALRDQAVRVVAHFTGLTAQEIEGDLPRWSAFLQRQQHPVRFLGRTVRPETVGEVIAAETEFWGIPPVLTIIDNAYDLLQAEESAAEFRRVFGTLHEIAKERRTCMLVLHHLKREASSRDDSEAGAKPVTMSAGMYGGEHQAELLLGPWLPEPGVMRVGILKNRMGRANRSGSYYVDLGLDLEKAQVYEDQAGSWARSLARRA